MEEKYIVYDIHKKSQTIEKDGDNGNRYPPNPCNSSLRSSNSLFRDGDYNVVTIPYYTKSFLVLALKYN